MKKFILLSLLGTAIFSSNVHAQNYDSLFIRAGFYYENDEYLMAIPRLNEYIKHRPFDFPALTMRGNCYLETGQNQYAINDFRSALELKNDASDLIYNLGIAYDRNLNTEMAIYYFRKYSELEPLRSEGYTRLSILYMYAKPELIDSAIYFAGKAVHSEPENPMNYNFLALAYYSDDQFSNALETALRGLVIDSSLSILNRTAGINCFFLKDYKSAIKYFDRAFKMDPDDFVLQDFKIQTMLLQNTKPEKFSFPSGGVVALTGISTENIKNIEDQIADSNGKYFYHALVSKLKSTPFTMSLDEFFMLYYGSSMDENYAPFYKTSTEKKPETDLIKKAGQLEEQVVKIPTDFPLYLSLADVYLEMGYEKKYFENRFKYFGFIESIKAAGDGLSPETAYIITDFSHEYNIMVSLGYKIKAQARIKQKKQNFDLISATDENDNEVLVYFNIDKPFEKLPKKVKK